MSLRLVFVSRKECGGVALRIVSLFGGCRKAPAHSCDPGVLGGEVRLFTRWLGQRSVVAILASYF